MSEIDIGGPLFDGRADAVTAIRVLQLGEDVAGEAYDQVQRNLSGSLRNPTGRYQRAVREDRRGDWNLVHDSGVVYGPWLEGTGSRNNSTRFKGYASFRRALAAVQPRVQEIAELAVADIAKEIG